MVSRAESLKPLKERFRTASRAHTVYTNHEGSTVPGVTTITDSLPDDGGLIVAANKLGLDGVDWNTYCGQSKFVGTLTHTKIFHRLRGVEFDKRIELDYTGTQIEVANVAYAAFERWLSRHSVRPVLLEQQVHGYSFGGTVDFFGYVDDILQVIDWKTSSKIEWNYRVQTEAYSMLIEHYARENPELDIPTQWDRNSVLLLPRTSDYGYEFTSWERDPLVKELIVSALKTRELAHRVKGISGKRSALNVTEKQDERGA